MGCHCNSNKLIEKEDIKIESLNNNNLNESTSITNLNYLSKFDLNNSNNKIFINDSINSPQTLNKDSINTDQNIINIETFNKNTKLETIRMSLYYEINSVRTRPESLITKIEKYMNNISKQKNGKYYLKVDEINNINLNKGKKIFEECKNLLKGKIPVKQFILKNELTFPFPEYYTEVSECIKENYLTETINKIKENFKEFEIVNFHYDIMTFNTELSIVLQIVDDTNSMFQRRNNLLNKNIKYIGINVGKVSEGIFLYYFLFANDKKYSLKIN